MKFPAQTNEAYLTWLQDNGATSGAIQDAEHQMLASQGATGTQLDDMYMEVLGSLGYTGALNDRKAAFWADGATFGSTWSPLALFASGETGLWLSSADLTTLFQSSDGTTPVSANADPIGYWGDKSGNTNHVIQATSGSRPTYVSASPGVLFDGTDDRLTVASGLAATSGSFIINFKTKATAFSAAQVLVSCADEGTANNWFELGVDSIGRVYIESNSGGTKVTQTCPTILEPSTTYTLTVVKNADGIYAEVDGVEQNPLIVDSTSAQTWFGDVTGADNTVIGGCITSAGLVRPWNGEIREVIITSKDILA